MRDLTYALTEDIGDPDLFVGRQEEMARLLGWAESTYVADLEVDGAPVSM